MSSSQKPASAGAKTGTSSAAPGTTVAKLKTRKLRRGTSSCWECKKRKIRCDFDPSGKSACDGCKRRGSRCIPQHLPENSKNAIPNDNYSEVGLRMQRVESLVNRLVEGSTEHGGLDGSVESNGLPQQSSKLDDQVILANKGYRRLEPMPKEALLHKSGGEPAPEQQATGLQDVQPSSQLLMMRPSGHPLSLLMKSALPTQAIASKILGRSNLLTLTVKMLRNPLKNFIRASGAEEANSALQPFSPGAPISQARSLIELALCLQQLSISSRASDIGLDRPAKEIANEYFDAASRYVTSHDSILTSAEGIETLMLEGIYHISKGQWHPAWLVFRRAIGLAHLIGTPAQPENVGISETHRYVSEYLWFRLNYLERYISLLLCLPSTGGDDDFAEAHVLAQADPLERVDRLHAMVTTGIIARNERMRRNKKVNGVPYDHYRVTQTLDHELKRATRILPAKSWQIRAQKGIPTELELRERMARFVVIHHHYHLILFIHLPYVIPGFSNPQSGRAVPDYTYSKHAALAASRDILSRYIMTTANNKVGPTLTPGTVIKASMAAQTLVLAHIDGHRLGEENMLTHQRLHDISLIDQIAQSIEIIEMANDDPVRHSALTALKKLLEIEALAADGIIYHVWCDNVAFGKVMECVIQESENGLEILLPYYGTVRIWRQMSPDTAPSVDMYESDFSFGSASRISPASDTDNGSPGSQPTIHYPQLFPDPILCPSPDLVMDSIDLSQIAADFPWAVPPEQDLQQIINIPETAFDLKWPAE